MSLHKLIRVVSILVAITGLSLRGGGRGPGAGGRGFPPAIMNVFPGYFQRKIEPKEIPSCLIPRLLVVFTRQLEILVTTLHYSNSIFCKMHADSPGVEFLRVIFKFRKREKTKITLY